MQQPIKQKPHSVAIDSRACARISGINEVLSYDDSSVLAASDYGEIVIEGSSLKIKSFDVSDGVLTIEGSIDSVHYINALSKKSGIFERLFK